MPARIRAKELGRIKSLAKTRIRGRVEVPPSPARLQMGKGSRLNSRTTRMSSMLTAHARTYHSMVHKTQSPLSSPTRSRTRLKNSQMRQQRQLTTSTSMGTSTTRRKKRRKRKRRSSRHLFSPLSRKLGPAKRKSMRPCLMIACPRSSALLRVRRRSQELLSSRMPKASNRSMKCLRSLRKRRTF